MYPRSITSQNSQTTLKTVFKSGCRFLVFLLFANAAAIAAEVPDLGVETVSINRTTLHPGDTFRLETRIRNHGTAAATPATLSYYLSPDDTISREDTEIQTQTLPRIAAGGTLERSVHLTAPDTPGTYYYGVCVNTVAAEADTTHNCSSATAITVKGADLMIFDAPQLSKNTLKSGETLSVNTRVWNRGRIPSPQTTLRYYRSTDETLSLDDTEVASDAVPPLSGRSAHPSRRRADLSKTLTAPETPGTHYYIVCVDATPGDTDTLNNCSQGIPITVEAQAPTLIPSAAKRDTPQIQGPDLVIPSARVESPTVMIGGGVRLHITLTNQGTHAAPATTIRYYRSLDATISADDTELRAVNVGQLNAGEIIAPWALLLSPTVSGVYYYGACVDAVASESDTSNNCSFGIRVTAAAQGAGQKLLLPIGTIPAQHLEVGGSPVVLDVSGNFVGQVERWTASFRGTGAVAVRVSGPEMTLVPISKGWWIVTIEARSRNLVAKQTFPVSVRDADTPIPVGDTLLDLSPEISIPDANLRAVVRTALGLTEDETLTQQKMHRLTRLSAPAHGITNLTGLEHAIRLTELDMPGNQIADITPLRNLTTLFRIVLNDNSITNITSLTGLTRLRHLNLSENRIHYIHSLANLIGITELQLQQNQIGNIQPLVGLTRLTKLSLSENQIINIQPLTDLLTLTEVSLRQNQISNVAPLETLTALTLLELTGNTITDLAPLRRLKAENPAIAIDIDITEDTQNVQAAPAAPLTPAETALLSNYPNPFNPETWIPYQLAEATDVTLTIYDITGREVRRLALGHRPAGFYRSRGRAAHWDGRNQIGEKVATGLYFYTLTTGEFTATGKMLIQK